MKPPAFAAAVRSVLPQATSVHLQQRWDERGTLSSLSVTLADDAVVWPDDEDEPRCSAELATALRTLGMDPEGELPAGEPLAVSLEDGRVTLFDQCARHPNARVRQLWSAGQERLVSIGRAGDLYGDDTDEDLPVAS